MGRIKTKQIKRITTDLMESYGQNFSTDFSQNKEFVSQYADVKSKKLRNTIAGYVTRLRKAE